MRRSSLIAVGALSVLALISACATSPTDDLGDTVQESKSAEPPPENNSAKLPPKTVATEDAGTADSATPDTGSSSSSSGSTSSSSGSTSSSSGSTSSSSGSTSSSSGSTSSGGSSSGGVGPACNVGDPLKLIIYQLEVSNQATSVPCPCAATKCCYLGVTCIDP